MWYTTKKICRAILLYQQPSCLVELYEPVRQVLMWTCHLKLYYRDVELCQGIWALKVAGVLFFVVYIYVHTSVLQRHFAEYLFFLSSNCQSVCIMYKIKYILNILRDILYLTMKLCFSILISSWKYHSCIVSY